jgi:hypothetical protein
MLEHARQRANSNAKGCHSACNVKTCTARTGTVLADPVFKALTPLSLGIPLDMILAFELLGAVKASEH